MTNSHKPYFRVWVLSAQTPGGSHGVVVNGVGPGLDINSDHFTVAGCLHLRANRAFINLIPTPSCLFSGVARLLCRHDISPGLHPEGRWTGLCVPTCSHCIRHIVQCKTAFWTNQASQEPNAHASGAADGRSEARA